MKLPLIGKFCECNPCESFKFLYGKWFICCRISPHCMLYPTPLVVHIVSKSLISKIFVSLSNFEFICIIFNQIASINGVHRSARRVLKVGGPMCRVCATNPENLPVNYVCSAPSQLLRGIVVLAPLERLEV